MKRLKRNIIDNVNRSWLNVSTLSKCIIILMLFVVSILSIPTVISAVNAQSDAAAVDSAKTVKIYFFWGDGCPHCETQKRFFDSIKSDYPEIEIIMLETWRNPDNARIFTEMAKVYGTTAQGVPMTFIGDFAPIVGYGGDQTTGAEIERRITYCIENGCIDPAEKALSSGSSPKNDFPADISICIHAFIDDRCGECEATKAYIDSLELDGVDIIYHNINDPIEKSLYEKFKNTYGLTVGGYPTLFIGENYLIGQDSIRKNLVGIIDDCKHIGCPCPGDKVKGITPFLPKKEDYKAETSETINLPLVGDIDIGSMPLILMTGLIAFIDGFNPCSLWVLTFLLGIVIYTGSRKKILLIGLTFLTITTLAYGLFMLGLVNVFTYIGYTFWIKIAVAAIATIFALVNIKDYFWYKKGISFTISDKHKPKLYKKVRGLMDPTKSTGGMMAATALMALGIVLVELPCTAGFPMIWTNIISQHGVTGAEFAGLLGLYLFIYLLLEIVLFAGVAITLKTSRFEEKHGRILKLVGGMIMLALAVTMLFFSDLMNTVTGSVYLFGTAILVSIAIMFLHRRVLPRFGINIGSEFNDESENSGKTGSEEKGGLSQGVTKTEPEEADLQKESENGYNENPEKNEKLKSDSDDDRK